MQHDAVSTSYLCPEAKVCNGDHEPTNEGKVARMYSVAWRFTFDALHNRSHTP